MKLTTINIFWISRRVESVGKIGLKHWGLGEFITTRAPEGYAGVSALRVISALALRRDLLSASAVG
jgi:hypothetical protein